MSPLVLYASPIKKDRVLGFAVSFFMHSFLFIGGGLMMAQPVQYAVEAGAGGIEVNLTAAPAEPVVAVVAVPEPPAIREEDKIEDPQEMPVPQPAPVERKTPAVSADGKDKTTFYSSGGALTEAKPNYLKNPAPAYPLEARNKGWEGTVLLRVAVDKAGRPVSVEKEKSSGYGVLDESAVKTVRRWKFRPAQLGALTVESSVRIPIRFELDDTKR